MRRQQNVMTTCELLRRNNADLTTLKHLPKDRWMKQRIKTIGEPDETPGNCSIFSVKSTYGRQTKLVSRLGFFAVFLDTLKFTNQSQHLRDVLNGRFYETFSENSFWSDKNVKFFTSSGEKSSTSPRTVREVTTSEGTQDHILPLKSSGTYLTEKSI